jgi:hypothetical protein
LITNFLATELNADIVTAPEVVTLNGQNVEFLSGEKQPFRLGQTVMQNDTKSIQQFFYKHVGTYISVTPRIVDWGVHGEGKGNAAIVETEILDWNGLLDFMIHGDLAEPDEKPQWQKYLGGNRLLPYELRKDVLTRLNQFTREDILRYLAEHPEYATIFATDECGAPVCGRNGCNWHPEECMLDLEIVVRLSENANANLTAERGGSSANVTVNAEGNVRALADILQVKSGHGAVMAGLIGERDVEEVVKVPVLGDVPVAGYLFRSKATNRQKSEVLIFVEASVVDSNPCRARGQTAADFQLAQPHLAGELLDTPLETGMYQEGFGSYLPPRSKQEQVYWEQNARRCRKMSTEIHDALH